jgi:hypothetical protein
MIPRTTYNPHAFWILTGVAVRLGQRIGLHRDPEELGLKPFDVQLRRRLFWQLLPLDGIASQLSGTGIAVTYDSWDTKPPFNLDDSDIWPDMTEAPTEREGATDMMFCLMRTEMGRFHQKVKPFLGNWARFWEVGDMSAIDEMEQAIQELERTMEGKYLRYCDPVNSLHLLALLMGRGAPQNARLRLRLPRVRANPNLSDPERQEIWKMCLKMFDYVCLDLYFTPTSHITNLFAGHLGPHQPGFEKVLMAFTSRIPMGLLNLDSERAPPRLDRYHRPSGRLDAAGMDVRNPPSIHVRRTGFARRDSQTRRQSMGRPARKLPLALGQRAGLHR